eukprot:8536781-Karenia_brevis.AAC.1
MVLPNNLYQVEVRSRTATGDVHASFGGLASLFSGDFLQLPPVDGPSLAFRWEDIQKLRAEIDAEPCNASKRIRKGKQPTAQEQKEAEIREAEIRGGCELWASMKTVVSLSLNMRSSGVLARILEEMRGKSLRDDSWMMLQDRVLGVMRAANGDLK